MMKLFTLMLLLIMSGNVFAHKGVHITGDPLLGILHISNSQALIFLAASLVLIPALGGIMFLLRRLRKHKAAYSSNR
jgi:hypothetical protein